MIDCFSSELKSLPNLIQNLPGHIVNDYTSDLAIFPGGHHELLEPV